jgi:hypothetical protein
MPMPLNRNQQHAEHVQFHYQRDSGKSPNFRIPAISDKHLITDPDPELLQ